MTLLPPRRRTLAPLLLPLICALGLTSLASCDAGGGMDPIDEGTTGDPTGTTGQGTVQTVTLPPPAPNPGEELPVTSSEAPELFPDVGDSGVVFYRPVLVLDEVSEEEAEGLTTDSCMSCLHCYYCEWDVIYQPFDGSPEQTLDSVQNPQTALRLVGHRALWVQPQSGQSRVVVHDLTTNQQTNVDVQGGSWVGIVPELRGDWIYWHGYMYGWGANGMIATNIINENSKLKFTASMHQPYMNTPSQAALLTRRQPFILDDDRAIWSEWSGNGIALKVGTMSTETSTILVGSAGWDYIHPVVVGGRVAWKAYSHEKGCYDAVCDLTLMAKLPDGPPEDVTSATAAPSRYAPLAARGDQLLWVDYRDGPYAIYGRDLSDSKAPEQRLTSTEAVLSATAQPVVYGDTLVWMDRRTGNWDIYRKSLAPAP